MATQRDFAPQIDSEDVRLTFSPMEHEQPLARAVRDWLKQNHFTAYLQPILADRSNVVALPHGKPQEVLNMWRDNNVFNETGIPSLTFGPPRTREKETNRLCFELADLVNMANVYARVASAICQ